MCTFTPISQCFDDDEAIMRMWEIWLLCAFIQSGNKKHV